MAQEYLTAEQIAAELRVDVNTVRRHFRSGGLPGRKVGHGWVTTRAALDSWLTGPGAGSSALDVQHTDPQIESKERPGA